MKTLSWLCIALAMAGTAQAQTRYQCRSTSGSYYLSYSPCPGDGIVYYGPTGSGPAPRTYVPKVGEAPDHIKYMSPRCSGLHDAIRTGPVRGLSSDTLSTMRKDYYRECGEEENEARSRLGMELGEKRQQRRSDQMAERQAQDQAKAHEQRCGESKRILYAKRARTDLNEGEKADLRRFEENYRARCGG